MIKLKSTVLHFFKNDADKLKEIREYLESELNRKAVSIRAKKTIPLFNLKKKSIVGGKITYNGNEGLKFLQIAKKVINNKSIKDSGFTIGIKEYSDLALFTYDSSKPLFGFDITFNFSSQGSRIKERKRKKTKFTNLSKREDIIFFLKDNNYEVQ